MYICTTYMCVQLPYIFQKEKYTLSVITCCCCGLWTCNLPKHLLTLVAVWLVFIVLLMCLSHSSFLILPQFSPWDQGSSREGGERKCVPRSLSPGCEAGWRGTCESPVVDRLFYLWMHVRINPCVNFYLFFSPDSDVLCLHSCVLSRSSFQSGRACHKPIQVASVSCLRLS